MNALVEQKGMHSLDLKQDEIELIKATICKDATDNELKLFLNQCKTTGLNPLARQIYAVKRWDSSAQRNVMGIQVSIDGFRLIAERTGKYAGQEGPFWCGDDGIWKDVWVSHLPPTACKVGVLKHGFNSICWGVARFKAYVQTKKDGTPVHMWNTMGDVMIAKCAESLALRKAFPQELSGLYTNDEMSQSENGQDDTPKKPSLQPPVAVTAPIDPETGECKPHKIATPEDGDSQGWNRFSELYAAAVKSAKTSEEFELWVRLNPAGLGKLMQEAPKRHERLLTLIKTIRSSFKQPEGEVINVESV
jgi:phage recombination protein Bet